SAGRRVERVDAVGDVGRVAKQVEAQAEQVAQDVDLERLGQGGRVDRVDRVVDALAVLEDGVALTLRDLLVHVVELARRVRGTPRLDVVVERRRVEDAEPLGGRWARGAR